MSVATFRRTKTDSGFEHVDQARQRLEQTIVLYDGRGYYVNTVAENSERVPSVYVGELPWDFGSSKQKFEQKRLDDPAFNKFKPFELGFVNLFDSPSGITNDYNTLFTYRRPIRSGARQGLSRESIDGRYLQGSRGGRLEGLDLFNQLAPCKSFADMLAGSYPTFDEALTNLIPESSIAFARNYALLTDKDGLVWVYRQLERIGLVNNKSKEFFLFSAKKFLREEIQESGLFPNIQAEI
jgi:hypothetical protein